MAIRPRFTTPFSRARDAIVGVLLRPLHVLQPRTLFLIGFGLLVVLTVPLLLGTFSSGSAQEYKEGEVVRESVVARTDSTGIDIAETERRRNAARESTRPVFNFDSTRGATSARSFRAAWEDLQQQSETAPSQVQTWSGEGGSAVARAIAAHNFSQDELDRLARMIRDISDKYIYDDADGERLTREIVLVDVRNPSGHMIMPGPRTRMMSLSEARRELELRILSLPGWSQEHKAALVSAILPLVRPNVVLDQTATATARETEANKIPNVTISLKRNQKIACEGDIVTPNMLAQFAAMKTTGQEGRPWHHLIGLLLIVFAVYWAVWKFTEHRSKATALSLSRNRAFALVGSAIVVQTVLMRVGFTLSDAIAGR
ncbi:MAG TPA: hypothetical protein VJV03_14730, partial [Pyrinomonadaceae bacterium]|nr:hypothetical protein [Pyrinomonadaceae bacterium]